MIHPRVLINIVMEKSIEYTESFETEPWLTSRLLYLVGAINDDSKVDLSGAEYGDLKFIKWLKVSDLFSRVRQYIQLPSKRMRDMTARELVDYEYNGGPDGITSDLSTELAQRLDYVCRMLEVCNYRLGELSDEDRIIGESIDNSDPVVYTRTYIKQFIGEVI